MWSELSAAVPLALATNCAAVSVPVPTIVVKIAFSRTDGIGGDVEVGDVVDVGRRIEGGVEHELVAAVAAHENVVARPASEHVIAATAPQDVVSGVADQRVSKRVARAVDVVAARQRQVLDVLAPQAIAHRAQHRVGALAARLDHHVPGMVHDILVIARDARHRVGPGGTYDCPPQRCRKVPPGSRHRCGSCHWRWPCRWSCWRPGSTASP